MSLDVVNGVLAKLADDADLHDDLKQPQVQVVSALCVVCVGSITLQRVCVCD